MTSRSSCTWKPLSTKYPFELVSSIRRLAVATSNAPVMLARTMCAGSSCSDPQVADQHRHHGARVERQVLPRGLNGVLVVVAGPHAGRAQPARGNRQHARPGAHVQHVAPVHARAAAAPSGTGAWWRGGRCRTPSTAGSRSSTGTSHGGATMMPPTVTALSPACERAAQSSSAIASGVAVALGNARRTCASAWSREAVVRKKMRQPSGRALVDGLDVEVEQVGLQQVGRGLAEAGDLQRGPGAMRRVGHGPRLPEDVLDALEDAAILAAPAGVGSWALGRHASPPAARAASSVPWSASSASAPSPTRAGRPCRGRPRRACRGPSAGKSCRSACPGESTTASGAVECRHLDVAAERERGEGHRHLAVEIVAVAPEERVVLHVDDDVEVAGRAAAGPGLAFAGQPHALSRGDAGRNAHGELAFLLHASGARGRWGRAWR